MFLKEFYLGGIYNSYKKWYGFLEINSLESKSLLYKDNSYNLYSPHHKEIIRNSKSYKELCFSNIKYYSQSPFFIFMRILKMIKEWPEYLIKRVYNFRKVFRVKDLFC